MRLVSGGLSLLVLLAMTCGPAKATDAPQTQLPTIGTTRSRPLCSAVRQNIAPAIAGLMRVDARIVATRKVLVDLAHLSGDPQSHLKLEGDKAMDMQRLRLASLVRGMTDDLALAKEALSRAPTRMASADDDRLAQDARTQLLAVAARQQDAVNEIGGLVETEAQGQMRTEYDSTLGPKLPTADRNSPPMPSPLSGSGLQLKDPVPVFDQRRMLIDDTAPGHTLYDRVSNDVAARQAIIATAERIVTPTIENAARACGSTPQPDR